MLAGGVTRPEFREATSSRTSRAKLGSPPILGIGAVRRNASSFSAPMPSISPGHQGPVEGASVARLNPVDGCGAGSRRPSWST